jgi:hypothetical protein
VELPPIAEIVLVQEPLIEAKLQVGQRDGPCIMAGEPVAARHGVVLLPDAEAMEMKVAPSKADLQGEVQVGQGAVGADEKAPPERRVNVPDPGVEEVSFGLGIVFHGGLSLPAGQRLAGSGA